VKNKFHFKYNFLIGGFFFILFISACKEYSSIGLEVLPAGDLIEVRNTLIKEDISAFTRREDSISTDEASNSLLGSFNDSLFGVTTVDFATQFRLSGFPDFGEDNPQPDSIKLYLYYRVIYGDTLTKQKIRVYELESSIDPDQSYTQEVDLKSMASDELLGETEFTPRVRLDSTTKDTFYQLINVKLDYSLAEKLFYADSTDLVNNDVFLEYFKGLYIESEKINSQGGAILSLETVSSSTFRGSGIVLFYHNDVLKSKVDPQKDSVLIMPYVVTQYSARVNRIVHDYTKAPFYPNMRSENFEDSLIYIQATGGLKSKIYINDLTSWKDSVNTAINKAELIFQIDTIASQVHKFPPPGQLLFLVDSIGKSYLPIDYVFSPSFYGGSLQKDYTYHFNITQHVQQIIDGKVLNFGFSLVPAYKNNQANRAVLKGSTSKTGIKLSITYSKYNN
jgi:hypothetical protein